MLPLPSHNEQEQINELFQSDSKFIGEFRCDEYKVIRGYIGGYGDELRLYYTKFEPIIKKASLCIVHGFGEHQGRFLHLADFFAKNQFTVHLIDLRGFGYSGGARGSQTIPQLHMDIEVLMRQVSKELPLYLYGHAMGALLLITLIMRNPQLKIAGLITTSPLLGLPMDRKIKGIKYWLVRLFGSFFEVFQKQSQYFQDLVINTKQNPTSLTKNNYHIQRCFGDRLMMPFLGIGMAQSIIHTQGMLQQKRQYFKESILILHGKQDAIANYKESVKFYQKCGRFLNILNIWLSSDKTLKLFENGYHELQHDEEYEEMKNIMLQWCLERIPRSKPFGVLTNRLNYGWPLKRKRTIRIILLLILGLIYMYYILKLSRNNQFNGKYLKYPILPIIFALQQYKKLTKTIDGNNI